jgi:deoxyribodipyrimidine photo-lyase
MQKERFNLRNDAPIKDEGPILYWLQHTQRIDQNYALYHAINLANTHQKPLQVLFILNPDYPEANVRHFSFMLEGLDALFNDLDHHGIEAVMEMGPFEKAIEPYLASASALVIDKAYTRYLRDVKDTVTLNAKKHQLYVMKVESDHIVPIETTSDKLEYAARTIRPKLLKQKDAYLELYPLPELKIKKGANRSLIKPDLKSFLASLPIDHSVKPSSIFKGGELQALKHLDQFIHNGLEHYQDANDPTKTYNSYLSPYLHFGQISPVRIYNEVIKQEHKIPQESLEGYLEQLLVRRELAFNFIYYQEGYDQFESMTYDWAYQTMKKHENDPREFVYTIDDYLSLATHDPYFNQAMKTMIEEGIMPNYMRMYWGKKILEWSSSYKEAYETTLYLNNKFFIDGRDANSYTGVAWIYGRHDRPWGERPIFGTLRYMNDKGLERKFDMKKYITTSSHLGKNR